MKENARQLEREMEQQRQFEQEQSNIDRRNRYDRQWISRQKENKRYGY